VFVPIEPVEPNIVSLRGISLVFVIFGPSVVSGSHVLCMPFSRNCCTFSGDMH
jgi:hypothetical protein